MRLKSAAECGIVWHRNIEWLEAIMGQGTKVSCCWRLELAEKLGADAVANPRRTEAVQAVREFTEGYL